MDTNSFRNLSHLKKFIPETSYKVRKMILKTQINKKREVKIYVEVLKYENAGTGNYSKKIRRLPTELWILPEHWSKKKELVLSKDPQHKEKNAMIDEIYIAIIEYLNNRQPQKFNFRYPYEISVNLEKLRINFDKIHELFPPNIESKIKGLVDYFEDYITYRKNRNTPRGTLKEFTTVKNRISKYDQHRNKRTLLHDINIIWSDSFETYLLKIAPNRDKIGYSLGTIEKTYSVLITVLYHYFKRRDELKINLPDKFTNSDFKRGTKSRNEPNPLNKTQFKTLFNHGFEEVHLELTKKRFCLQCSTGLRFGDIDRIRPEMIKDNVLTIIPKKSLHREKPKSAVIPLNKYSNQILKEFEFNTSCLHIQNQPYNRNLLEIFKKLRKKHPKLNFKNYSTHDGRDSFISMAVESGVDFKTILEWTAQSSYEIMDRYIKTTDEHKRKLMEETWDF